MAGMEGWKEGEVGGGGGWRDKWEGTGENRGRDGFFTVVLWYVGCSNMRPVCLACCLATLPSNPASSIHSASPAHSQILVMLS